MTGKEIWGALLCLVIGAVEFIILRSFLYVQYYSDEPLTDEETAEGKNQTGFPNAFVKRLARAMLLATIPPIVFFTGRAIYLLARHQIQTADIMRSLNFSLSLNWVDASVTFLVIIVPYFIVVSGIYDRLKKNELETEPKGKKFSLFLCCCV